METTLESIQAEFDIISGTEDTDAVVNIVAQKGNDLCLIAVRGGCAEEFVPLTPEERKTIQEYMAELKRIAYETFDTSI